jgi:hypothetical protein
MCKADHSETESGFIVLRVGGDARRQVGLAGLEMAALQSLPRDVRGVSRQGGQGASQARAKANANANQRGMGRFLFADLPMLSVGPFTRARNAPGRRSTTGPRGGRT